MVSNNGQGNGHVEQPPRPVQVRPKWAGECVIREHDNGYGVLYSVYHPSEHVLLPSGRSVKWIECTSLAHGSVYGTHADALDALDDAARLNIAPPEDAEAVEQFDEATGPMPDDGSRAAAEANAEATEKAADWRKTECVIEGPDDCGFCRILHVPSGTFWSGTPDHVFVAGRGKNGGRYYFGKPGTTEKGCCDEGPADRVLASIPDSARPSISDLVDYTARPVPATDAAIEQTVNDLADAFGLPKPPEGKGAPAAPSPLADQFGETFAPGMIVEPCLRPGDHYVVDLVTPERMTVIPCGGGQVFTVVPEAVKFWRISATRSAERPERDPEDIATQILALIEERTLNRVEVRGLVMKLLRCCA